MEVFMIKYLLIGILAFGAGASISDQKKEELYKEAKSYITSKLSLRNNKSQSLKKKKVVSKKKKKPKKVVEHYYLHKVSKNNPFDSQNNAVCFIKSKNFKERTIEYFCQGNPEKQEILARNLVRSFFKEGRL